MQHNLLTMLGILIMVRQAHHERGTYSETPLGYYTCVAGGGYMEVSKISTAQMQDALASLPGWSIENDKLHREYVFGDFVEAFGFMTQVALLAERMNHHPDWSNVYKKVVVDLVTHEVGGITRKDIELAQRMEGLVAP
jgi:4a-hydroxytetrahydrobiopterin dehydratase